MWLHSGMLMSITPTAVPACLQAGVVFGAVQLCLLLLFSHHAPITTAVEEGGQAPLLQPEPEEEKQTQSNFVTM